MIIYQVPSIHALINPSSYSVTGYLVPYLIFSTGKDQKKNLSPAKASTPLGIVIGNG